MFHSGVDVAFEHCAPQTPTIDSQGSVEPAHSLSGPDPTIVPMQAIVSHGLSGMFDHASGLPRDPALPSDDAYGLPPLELINLLDFIKTRPPMLAQALFSHYEDWCGSPVEQEWGLLGLLQMNGLLHRVQTQFGIMVMMTGLRCDSQWSVERKRKSYTYTFDEPMKQPCIIQGEAIQSSPSTFLLVHKREADIDMSDFVWSGTPTVEANEDYICKQNGKLHVVKAMYEIMNNDSLTGTNWCVQFEDRTTGIYEAGELVPRSMTDADPFRTALLVRPTGRRPFNGEVVTIKVLHRLDDGSFVCCQSSENVCTKYRLTISPGRAVSVAVITWGGRSYITPSDARVLGVLEAPTVDLAAMSYPSALQKILLGENVRSDKFVHLFFVVAVLMQSGVETQLCKDTLLL